MQEKTFPTYINDNGHVSRIYKKHPQLNNKKANDPVLENSQKT